MIKEHGGNPVARRKIQFAMDSNEIPMMQNEISDAENTLTEQAKGVVYALDTGNTELAEKLANEYHINLAKFCKLNSALVTLYDAKIKALNDNEKNKVSDLQKEQIKKEVEEMEKMCCFGLKSDDLQSVLNQEIFSDLVDRFEEKCPLLHGVLQTLLVTDSKKRVYKTPTYKLTCGVNALCLLLSVKNQKCKNDIRLLLGLVCVTYGAGKQFINLLNSIGLTPHWDTMYV